MALPFALNHINLWLLRDSLPAEAGAPAREGWSIVDCGIDNAATRAAWEQMFASELDGLPVLRVIVTHMHPDHIGSANWLCERWNARLWISATDFGIARMASSARAPASAARSRRRSWRCTAWPPTRRRSTASPRAPTTTATSCRRCRRRTGACSTARCSRSARGAARADWTCRVGYGHAPEHIALDCAERSAS